MDLEPQFNVFPCQNITSAQGHTPAPSFSASFVRWAKLQFLFFLGWVGCKPLASFAWICSPSSSKHLMYYWRHSTRPSATGLACIINLDVCLAAPVLNLVLGCTNTQVKTEFLSSGLSFLFIQSDASIFLCLCLLNSVPASTLVISSCFQLSLKDLCKWVTMIFLFKPFTPGCNYLELLRWQEY